MGTTVVVAAEVRFYREGLATYLEHEPALTVLAAAVNHEDVLDKAARFRPDVLLLDMTMAESLAIVRDLCGMQPPVRVVALAVCENEHDVLACAEAGVAGYVPREGSLADLVRTIECVGRSELIASPRIAASLMRRVAQLASSLPAADRRAALTVREREIVRLIEEGMSNKQIAARLGIELATAKNHVHNILDKLQVHRRGQVVMQMRYEHARGLDTA